MTDTKTKTPILIVEDEQSLRQLLSHVLTLAGFLVSTAANAAEFREAASRQKPALIVLDILLEDQNGLEVYGQLLKEGLNPDIPVIVLSALVEEKWRPVEFRAHARHAFISKPFEHKELIRKIRELIKPAG